MASLTDIYHFLPLTPNLLTAGQPTEAQFQLIAAASVNAVINLALPTSSGALKNEAGLVKSLGMDYIHIPVIWENPTYENLDRFFTAMDAAAEVKVFVHCAANMRVSAFVALYRIKRLGWTRQKAFTETYRIWDPFQDPVWGPFIESVLASKWEQK